MPRAPVLTRFDTDSGVQLQRGVFDALDRAGFPVRVDPDLAYEVGDEYGAAPGDVDRVWWFADSGVPLAQLAALPGARVLASSSPLTPAEEAQASVLQQQLTDELAAAGRSDLVTSLDSRLAGVGLQDVPGVDLAAARRLGALNQRVYDLRECRCGVVSVPAATAPTSLGDLLARSGRRTD